MSPKNEQRTIASTNTIPDDNMIHPWLFQGEHLFRNYDNEVFSGTRDNLVWMGIYLPKENRIDTTVPEPEWADEDDADVMIVSEGPITLNGVIYAPGTVEIRDGVVSINNTIIEVGEDDEDDEEEEDEDERTDLTNLLDDDMFRQINESVCNLVFENIVDYVGVDEEKYNEYINDEIDSYSEVWSYIRSLSRNTKMKYLTFLGMEQRNDYSSVELRDSVFWAIRDVDIWSFDDYMGWINERTVHIG